MDPPARKSRHCRRSNYQIVRHFRLERPRSLACRPGKEGRKGIGRRLRRRTRTRETTRRPSTLTKGAIDILWDKTAKDGTTTLEAKIYRPVDSIEARARARERERERERERRKELSSDINRSWNKKMREFSPVSVTSAAFRLHETITSSLAILQNGYRIDITLE